MWPAVRSGVRLTLVNEYLYFVCLNWWITGQSQKPRGHRLRDNSRIVVSKALPCLYIHSAYTCYDAYTCTCILPICNEGSTVDGVTERFCCRAGCPLSLSQDDVVINGWAVECRVYAEVRGRRWEGEGGRGRRGRKGG